MLAQLFSIITPVFVCAGIGLLWARLGRAYDTEQVTVLVTTVGAPCLAFHTLSNVQLSTGSIAEMAGLGVASICLCAAIGAAVLALARLSGRIYLPSVMFGNTGNMGLPLVLLAFGEEGLALAIGIFVIHAVAMFTVGVAVSSGRLSLSSLARIPLLYAVAFALAFMATGTRPPEWINSTTQLLGGITIPMMLITLGTSLARLGVASLWRSLFLSVLRLAVGFGVAVGLATAFDLQGVARGVVIVQLSMPAAVFNYLFAQRYGQEPTEVAGIVVISTALSFLTLPALLWFAL